MNTQPTSQNCGRATTNLHSIPEGELQYSLTLKPSDPIIPGKLFVPVCCSERSDSVGSTRFWCETILFSLLLSAKTDLTGGGLGVPNFVRYVLLQLNNS